jgi:iron complex transport system substrate-binding protein
MTTSCLLHRLIHRQRTGRGGAEARRQNWLSLLFLRASAPSRLLTLVAVTSAWWVVAAGAQTSPARVVSLIPALTDMVLAIGGRPQLVAVSSYDIAPEVKGLPRVGALLDPDVERIISLRPDLVLVYGSQTDLMTQLRRASIPFYEYRHGGLMHIVSTIRELGKRVGRSTQAETLARSIETRVAAVGAKTASARKPRAMIVFGRERGTLRGIYVSGGRGFLHDMLEAAGGTNVFADSAPESVQVSAEQILARAPEVIIELRSNDTLSPAERQDEIRSWNALASVPAIRNRRVHLLVGKETVVPGPLVADGVEAFAQLLHP